MLFIVAGVVYTNFSIYFPPPEKLGDHSYLVNIDNNDFRLPHLG
jgi:hypothetical protein